MVGSLEKNKISLIMEAQKIGIQTVSNEELYKIIKKAFANGTDSNIKSRNFLLSRKTLLNEFNHCEFDLNIFQPAIDITNSALNKEKTEILEFLDEISQ